MRIFLSVFILLTILAAPVFAQTEIKLSGSKKSLLMISTNYPIVYRPTRLIIGKENIFQIKAAPGSNVSLAVSRSNSGAPKFFGQDLRLGSDITTKEAVVPENGLLELPYTIQNDKELVDKVLYFEVAVWKDKSFNDLKLAKIIAADGQETKINGSVLVMPPKDVSRPTLVPAISGLSDMMKTVETIEKIKSGKGGELEDQMQADIYYNTPALLRNMGSPEINQSK